MKQATLDKLKQAASEAAVRLLFLDEAGFCCSPPVQRSWSPRGLPHAIEPNTPTRRSVIGALDFGPNKLIHASCPGTVKGPDVMRFIDGLLADSNGRPTVIVLDNASIHHGIDEVRDRSFEQQRYRASRLNLVTAAIVLWNTVYLERAVQAMSDRRLAPAPALYSFLSPLGWEHINLTGDYVWRTNHKPGTGKFRPLRRLADR